MCSCGATGTCSGGWSSCAAACFSSPSPRRGSSRSRPRTASSRISFSCRSTFCASPPRCTSARSPAGISCRSFWSARRRGCYSPSPGLPGPFASSARLNFRRRSFSRSGASSCSPSSRRRGPSSPATSCRSFRRSRCSLRPISPRRRAKGWWLHNRSSLPRSAQQWPPLRLISPCSAARPSRPSASPMRPRFLRSRPCSP